MINLKNPKAQKLMELKTINIDGIEINLWHGHTRDTVFAQESWNKIGTYAEHNKQSSGVNGNLVFTGTMQIQRSEARDYAIKLGFKVRSKVSKNTDFIIVGTSNVSPNKVADALEFNENGKDIQFIDEISFLELVLENEDIMNIEVTSNNNQQAKCNEKRSSKKSETNKKINKILLIESDKLNGMSFVVSGSFASFSRDELKSIIEKNGGKNLSGVSSKTNYLVAGDKIGPSKLAKAEKLGIKIISEDEFKSLIE